MRLLDAAHSPGAASLLDRNDGYWRRFRTRRPKPLRRRPALPERPEWWHCDRNRTAAFPDLSSSVNVPLKRMPSAIVTLTTDFGTADHFVGCVKGVILG